MKLNFEVILATDTEDGDIFYCNPNAELNDFGPYAAMSGTDQIFIRDDYYDTDDDENYGIAINGGYVIWFAPNEKVVRLAHYGDLIRVVDMIQEGNPEMTIGANDINTIVDKISEIDPSFATSPLDSLNIDLFKPRKGDHDDDFEENDDFENNDEEFNNDDLPF